MRVVNVYAYDNKSRDKEPVMLWKTNFKSSGSSNDLRKVIPYMILTNIYSSWVYKDDPNMRVVFENDHIFKRWKRGDFSTPNCYLAKDYKYNRKDGCGFDAWQLYVEKKNGEIVICLKKMGCQSYKVSPELYLVYNGQETKVGYADDFQLGRSVKKECGVRYIVLHFPVNTDEIDSFEIREYTNSIHTDYKTWGIVEFTR